MKLGETLWDLGLSDEEKERISRSLHSNKSINSLVFVEHHRNHKVFDDICHKLTRKITGFRPTSEPYKQRVSAEVLKCLKLNRAKPEYWSLYQCAVVEHVVSKLSALNQLLGDSEFPDELELTSIEVLSRIAEKASEYSVSDKDVETLYELWPFPRVDQISDILARCPKFDRFRALDERLNSAEQRLGKEISDIRIHTLEELTEVRNEFRSNAITKKALISHDEKIQTKLNERLDPIEKAVQDFDKKVERLEKLIRRAEVKRSADRVEFANQTDNHLGKLGAELQGLREEQERIRAGLETATKVVQDRRAPAEAKSAAGSSVFSALTHSHLYDLDQKIGVKDARDRFGQIASDLADAPARYIDLYFYSALLCNCIVISDAKEFRLWQSTVGWAASSSTVCASPMWVDDSRLAHQIGWLFDQNDEPRTLTIVDFDLGYVEGYLRPFLAAWRHSGRLLPWKKILLIPSQGNWAVTESVAEMIAILPSVVGNTNRESIPHFEPDEYISPANLNEFIAQHCSGSSLPKNFGETALTGVGALQKDVLASIDAGIAADFDSELSVFWSSHCA